MDYRPLNRRALDLAAAVIAKVPPERLNGPTPCAPWTVRDLIGHLTGTSLRFAAAVRGDDPDAACPQDRADLGDDPAKAFRAAADSVAAAFDVPDLADRRVALEELPAALPGPVAVGFHLTDVYVHGWDIAVSAGLGFEPPADLTAAVLQRAEQIPDAARAPGGPFGAVVRAGGDGSPLERLLRLVGRDPAWSAS